MRDRLKGWWRISALFFVLNVAPNHGEWYSEVQKAILHLDFAISWNTISSFTYDYVCLQTWKCNVIFHCPGSHLDHRVKRGLFDPIFSFYSLGIRHAKSDTQSGYPYWNDIVTEALCPQSQSYHHQQTLNPMFPSTPPPRTKLKVGNDPNLGAPLWSGLTQICCWEWPLPAAASTCFNHWYHWHSLLLHFSRLEDVMFWMGEWSFASRLIVQNKLAMVLTEFSIQSSWASLATWQASSLPISWVWGRWWRWQSTWFLSLFVCS